MAGPLIIAIGRGSGGTRLLSEVLSASGVDMGPCNESGDLVPPDKMYEAVRMAGPLVKYRSLYSWDFSALLEAPPPAEFERLVREYLAPVLQSSSPRCGFKLPETLLALPWIVKLFPDAHYIYWTRDPRTATTVSHITDHLYRFSIPTSRRVAFSLLNARAVQSEIKLESWMYQWLLVQATPIPPPARYLRVLYEDFVANQPAELARLSAFLGFEVHPTRVDPEAVRAGQARAECVDSAIVEMYWRGRRT